MAIDARKMQNHDANDVNLIRHKSLAESERWFKMPLAQQMANVGSEVCRAAKWKEKENHDRTASAADRALELLDFTILSVQRSGKRLTELTRLREVLCDYFYGENSYGSTEESLNRYFRPFEQLAASQRYDR